MEHKYVVIKFLFWGNNLINRQLLNLPPERGRFISDSVKYVRMCVNSVNLCIMLVLTQFFIHNPG